MIAFAEMLVGPAEKAHIPVPENVEKYDPSAFPHWHVYTLLQLGAPMPYPDAHWNNAEIIAQLTVEEVMTMTAEEFAAAGVDIGYSIP